MGGILVRIAYPTHARHNLQDVVVDGIGVELQRRRGGSGQLEGRVVDARHVDGTRRLVGLRVQGKRVNVDTRGRDAGVVVVRLDEAKVLGGLDREAVVAVKEELGVDNDVVARAVVEIRPLLGGGLGVEVSDPNKLLDGVVEVELGADRGAGKGLGARELELLNEVLVLHLGKLVALLSVEVDVVNEQRGTAKRDRGDNATASRDNEVGDRAESDLNANIVVLQGNEGEGKTRVAVPEELERDKEGLGADRGSRGGEGRGVADHGVVTSGLLRLLGKLLVNLEPLAVVLVNALTTNLEFNLRNKDVAEVVDPLDGAGATVGDGGDTDLQEGRVNEVTVAGDGAGNLAAEIDRAVEGLLDVLNGEVGVATVNALEERDHRLVGKIKVLGPDGNQLHKTSRHSFFICII